jgi:hypothetical protein
MAQTSAPNLSPYQKALNQFQKTVSSQDYDEMKCGNLHDLQITILDIQRKYDRRAKAGNMSRLSRFLTVMEDYGKVIDVFSNTSPIVCFVWVCILVWHIRW